MQPGASHSLGWGGAIPPSAWILTESSMDVVDYEMIGSWLTGRGPFYFTEHGVPCTGHFYH